MNAVIAIVAAVLSALLLSLPILNHRVFHTINTDEIVIDGRESIKRIQDLMGLRNFPAAIDSCAGLVDRCSRDTLIYFTPDVQNWDSVRVILTGKRQHPWAQLILSDLDAADVEPLKDSGSVFSVELQRKVVKALNETKDDKGFFVDSQASLAVQDNRDLRSRVRGLAESGILAGSQGSYTLKEGLTPAEKDRLRRFQGLVLEDLVFPSFLHKDPRRGADWASEFIVQTAMFYMGSCYKLQYQLDDAIRVWNDLIRRYPKSIFAEVLFQQIGQALLDDGRKMQGEKNLAGAEARLHEAIGYLERIERNREVAERFPKYKYVDLQPGVYTNVDVASRAKALSKQETSIYTQKKAEADLSGKSKDDRSGYVLEDAVRLIGECYTALGRTDSARAEFKLILSFFPESDNLAAAQKLIADSYVKEGDLAAADSSDPQAAVRARKSYELAVKEYLTFANVYPQSDLISENYIALGDAYNKLGKPDDAAKAFASALGRAKEAEDQAKVQLKIGNYYFERQRLDQAIKAYKVILTNFLSTEVASNAQYMLGRCFMLKADTTEALRNFGVILEHYKQSSFLSGAAREIGDYYFNKGNYRDAEAAYNTGYTYDQEGNLAPKLKFQIGMIWRKIAATEQGAEHEKDLKQAIGHFKEVVDKFQGKAIGNDPDQASYQIAEIYKELGNQKAAREAAKNIEGREIKLKAVTLFRDASADSRQEDIRYWQSAIKDALDDEERSAALYEKANVLADRPDDYDSALAAFQLSLQLTKKTGKMINAQVGIARVYMNQKRFKEAADLFHELVENPKTPKELREQLQVQLYDAYLRQGDLDKALQGFQAFATEQPGHKLAAYACYRTGTILAEKKEYDKAQENLQVVLDKYPNAEVYDKAVLAIGEQKANRGEFKDAVDYLERYVKKNPTVPSAPNMYMKIADLYAKNLDKKQAAVDAYEQVLQGDTATSLYSAAAYYQGMVLKDLGNEDRALKAFQKVRKPDKSIYRACQAEIGKIIAKTDPERAISYYRNIVSDAESPDDTGRALIGIGDVYAEVKKPKQAADAYEQAYTQYHGSDTTLITGALVKRIDALINSQQYNEAIKVANLMQQRYPDHPLTINTYYFEANANFQLKRFAEARRVFGAIIKLNRSAQLTEIALYQIGETYYFAKEFEKAISEYGNYAKKYPKGQFAARAVYMQANCYVTLQEWGEAKKKFLDIVNDYPNFDEMCVAKNYLAFSLRRLDDKKGARKYYEQVINSGHCSGEPLKFAKEQREGLLTEQ